MSNVWGKLMTNGRGGGKVTFHTGICQHIKGYPDGTRAQNMRTGACHKCASPMTAKGLTHRPFEALERLINLAPSLWPTMTVHGAR